MNMKQKILFFGTMISLVLLTGSGWLEFLLSYEQSLTAIWVAAIAYTALIAFSFPVGAVVAVFIGYVFGLSTAFPMVLFSATIGAALIYSYRQAKVSIPKEVEEGFKTHGWTYLLFLRSVPTYTFQEVNAWAAKSPHITLGYYTVATFFGIAAGTLGYTWFGAALRDVSFAEPASFVTLIWPILLLWGLAVFPFKKVLKIE